MNRCAFFTGSSQALPAIEYLSQTDQLGCVVLVDSTPNPDLNQLVGYLQQRQLPFCRYDRQDPNQLLVHLDTFQASMGFIYLYRHILGKDTIDYFQQRLYNVHPSALPDYRGAFPLYWQLRNGEPEIPLTLHQVVEEPDAGAIGRQMTVGVHPFDTLQSLSIKVSRAVPQLVADFLEHVLDSSVVWCPQQTTASPAMAPKVQQEDLVIHWQKYNSKQLVDLTRAGNPNLGGALLNTPYGQFNLLQASVSDNDIAGLQPGTVLSLSQSAGLKVKTLDGAVRLDLLSAPEGLLDGYRFAVLYNLDAGAVLT